MGSQGPLGLRGGMGGMGRKGRRGTWGWRDLLVHQGQQEEGRCTSGGGGPPALACQEQNWSMRGLQLGHATIRREVDPTDSVCPKFPSTPATNRECKATVHCVGQSTSWVEGLPCQVYTITTFHVLSAMSALDLWSTLYQRGTSALLVGHSSTKVT